MIGTGIFHYIYHIGCAFNLHSIINNGLIPGGQDLSRRQTVFFLPIDPRDGNHKDPEHIDFSVPRRARYVHSAWKRHQDAVFWVDINLAIREGLTFYQTRSNAIILQGTLPACCIPKVERLKTGEMLYERRYLSPRPPPKISLKHDHNWTKGNDQSGSTVEHQPVGELVQQSLGEALRAGSSKPTQSKPNPIGDRTGKPVEQENTSCSREIVGKPFWLKPFLLEHCIARACGESLLFPGQTWQFMPRKGWTSFPTPSGWFEVIRGPRPKSEEWPRHQQWHSWSKGWWPAVSEASKPRVQRRWQRGTAPRASPDEVKAAAQRTWLSR